MNLKVCAAMGCALLVSSCAAPERPSSSEVAARWAERQAALASFDAWDLRGRLSVRVGDDGGQATVQWRRGTGNQELNLTGPFGRGLLRFTEDATGAHARDAEGHDYAAGDLSSLLFNLTGWRIPVARLQYWIRGLPSPDAPGVPTLDAAGRVKTLEQAGWRVRIADYMAHANMELPRRLFLSFPGDNGVPSIDLRFVVDSWSP